MITTRFVEEHAIVATIDPQTLNNTSATSDWVAVATYNRVVFLVNVGATDATVNAKLQSATDSSGTGAADITGKALTSALTATDDNTQVVLEITADELPDATNHCALVVTVGSGSSGALVSAVGVGTVPRNAPVVHLASVAATII